MQVRDVYEPGIATSRAPVVQERVHHVQKEIIQPVIKRDIDQPVLREVIEERGETVVIPPRDFQERRLPTIEKEGPLPPPPMVAQPLMSNRQEYQTERFVVQNPPIIEQTVHHQIREEIQPVIHRETIVPHVVKETQPIHEHIVEPTQVMYEYRKEGGMDDAAYQRYVHGSCASCGPACTNIEHLQRGFGTGDMLKAKEVSLDHPATFKHKVVVDNRPLDSSIPR